MADIFLSYNREDSAVARRFAEGLEREGFSVWWDIALRSGEVYDEVTEAALHGSGAVVVLWSPRSVVSRWVRAEATLADRAGKLIPVMIEACQRPIMFELTQTAELGHWQGDVGDCAWRGFVADLARHLQVAQSSSAAAPVAAPAPPKLAAEPMLAVLPFDNLSPDPEMDFFSDGVSEEIIGRITKGARLKVIGRVSSFQYRGNDKPRAAASLNASHVLDGSVRRAGARVRIMAHLSETAAQTSVWSECYDRNLTDVFELQDEIAEAIAEVMHATFSPRTCAPPSSAAFDVFLKARPATFTPDELKGMIAALEAVIAAEPGFGAASGRLAFLRAWLRFYVPYPERATMTLRIAAEAKRALDCDGEDSDALVALLISQPAFGSFHEMDRLIERIGDLPSLDGRIYTGRTLRAMGRVRESSAETELTFVQDPQNPMLANMVALGRMAQGREAEAVPVLEALIVRSPGNVFPVANLMRAHAFLGNWKAIDQLLDPATGRQLGEFAAGLPFIEAKRDPSTEKRTALLDDCRDYHARTGVLDVSRLVYAAHLGFVDEVYAMLDTAALGPQGTTDDIMGPDAYSTGMLFWRSMGEVRADPRFVKLCARLGLAQFWLESGKWPDCADETPYDFRAECEKYRGVAGDPFFG